MSVVSEGMCVVGYMEAVGVDEERGVSWLLTDPSDAVYVRGQGGLAHVRLAPGWSQI